MNVFGQAWQVSFVGAGCCPVCFEWALRVSHRGAALASLRLLLKHFERREQCRFAGRRGSTIIGESVLVVNVYYHLSHYVSHRVAGGHACRALAECGVELAGDMGKADIVILHDDPHWYPELRQRCRPDACIITYSVWEANILPASYVRNLSGVDRIWSCSPFSAAAFDAAEVAPVDVVPHVVLEPRASAEALESMRRRIGYEEGCTYFYTVVDSVNPRKNLQSLLRAFAAAAQSEPHIRLVVKQYRHAWDIRSLPQVVSIEEELSDEEMAALHLTCDAYVSAHHAEAWGLSLSDAMAAGNLVLATGYSGNMFYMNEENSLPVKYSLASVSQEMIEAVPLFTQEMSWADIDEQHLTYLMRRVAHGRVSPGIRAKARNTMQHFTPQAVGMRMKRLLEDIYRSGVTRR